jgi:hypothetical protein
MPSTPQRKCAGARPLQSHSSDEEEAAVLQVECVQTESESCASVAESIDDVEDTLRRQSRALDTLSEK